MAIVSVAILISFHLKREASALERRVALPFGLTFWLLAMACLGAGLNNYVKTVTRYSRRQALVQSGTGTQLVSFMILTELKICLANDLGGTGIHGGGNGDCSGVRAVPLD